MKPQNGVVDSIAEGGFGSEASIKVQLRTLFPGLGGTLITHEGVAAALRIERNACPMSGHQMFIRHLVVKKLEDHFYRSGKYTFSHIPRVLGSISCGSGEVAEAYMYEWAFGTDGFSWVAPGTGDQITLRDWNRFVDCFFSAGLDLQYDTTNPDDARISQNIVHQYPRWVGSDEMCEMCSLWKRIDFGFCSIRLDANRLLAYVRDHATELRQTLRCDRYEMLRLAVRYLADRDGMADYDLGRLDRFIGDYRRSSLRHYAYGFGPAAADVWVTDETESLLRGRCE
jgi:hypothetical protein